MQLIRAGREWQLEGFPVLRLPDPATDVKYFSVNPFLPDQTNRCPLECRYCICHKDDSWHHHPERFVEQPEALELIPILVDKILATEQGALGIPISICDFSDPFVPAHKFHSLAILRELGRRKAKNIVYLTTKAHPGTVYLKELKRVVDDFPTLHVIVYVSLSPLIKGIELVSIDSRKKLLRDLFQLGIQACWYLRPLHPDWFDEHVFDSLAEDLLPTVGPNILLSSLAISDEIETNLKSNNIPVPAWDRAQQGSKMPLSEQFEAEIRKRLGYWAKKLNLDIGPVMGHRICGANGYHAYPCLHCDKNDRYCKMFKGGSVGDIKITQL